MGEDLHCLEIAPVDQWPVFAADHLAWAIDEALSSRDRCLLGVSGGSTPDPVFRLLAARPLDWERVVIVQVDERVAPAGSPERNFTLQREAFAPVPATWLPLPVDDLVGENVHGPDAARVIEAAVGRFSAELAAFGEDPPVLDVVHLGLGDDGHTASLFTGDPALGELRASVALTRPYRGARRLTLTRPVLDRARLVLWLVRGEDKAKPLGRLLAGDLDMPAGLLCPRRSVILADAAAARQV